MTSMVVKYLITVGWHMAGGGVRAQGLIRLAC